MSTNMFVFRTGRQFYLLVQLLLQGCFNAIAEQNLVIGKENFNDEKFSGFCAVKMTNFGNLR